MSWRLNKTATYWPPALLAIAVLLSRSAGLLNRGPGGQTSAGTWFSLLELQQLTSNWSPTNWLPVAPGLYHCLSSTCFLWRHNSHSIQPVDCQGIPLTSSTGCTCYLHRYISHLTAWPGRKSICYKTSIWSITYQKQWTPWLGVYWCHFQQMRCYYLVMWTCSLFSGNHHFEWKWQLFD